MSISYPPLPEELVAFTEGGRSLLVGTCSADLVPDCVRACGLRIWPGASHLTVLVPAAPGAAAVANLRAHPRIALTVSHIPSHRTVQLKGAVTALRDGSPEDRAHAERYRELFSDELAWVGLPKAIGMRFGVWPLHAVDVAIEVVFTQTPGPAAGAKLPVEPA
ncbi:MAG: pyridoxamine 5'-phosphate oxidase family protein [Deltaproteobacteria bacterium]|nr:pyridoxamine 5'-phosphate oxidase family protein [Deltaproteobacteria bacterium]MCW5808414.1 pyridoxamine 5'-phosphate oxidase family protein [Deltaproteobacteria bacterium]